MYRNILVPLDGSPRAEAILPHAEDLARRYGARVILLHVDEEPALLLERDEVVDLDAYLEQRRRLGANVLRQCGSRRFAADRPAAPAGPRAVRQVTCLAPLQGRPLTGTALRRRRCRPAYGKGCRRQSVDTA